MARVSLYLPTQLHTAVKAAGVPISEVCQRALEAELARIAAEHTAREAVLWDRETPSRRMQR